MGNAILRKFSRLTALVLAIFFLFAALSPKLSNSSGEGGQSADSASDTQDDIQKLADYERIMALFTDEEREILVINGAINVEFVSFFIDEGYTDDEIWTLIEPLLSRYTAQSSFEKKVVLGEPLEWRVLREWNEQPLDTTYNWMFVDNFDGDPASEILLDVGEGFELIQLPNGAGTPLDIFNTIRITESWDFDGDGIAELFTQVETTASYDASETVDVMEAYSITGEHVGYVRGNPMGPSIARGDFNGDGVVDLYMSEESPYSADRTKKAQGFGKFGEVLFTAPAEWNSPYVITGDIDGDQRDEIINLLPAPGNAFTVNSINIDGDIKQLSSWTKHYPLEMPAWCCDLNQDGTDEMLSGSGLVYDFTNDATWKLEVPQGWDDMYFDGNFGPTVYAVELLELPNARVAATPAAEGIYPETFVLWDPEGNLLYAENFGELVLNLAIAHFDGSQHIVLLTESQLLLWP